MRAVWSFWSKPFNAGRKHVWREPRHHLLAWGLSLRLARRHYPDTVLVTDKAGKKLLVEQLGLEFDAVSTELEALGGDNPQWWALGKLFAYSIQDRPFVHIDYDVFLWKPLPAHVVDAPVFAQCPEFHPPLDEWASPAEIEAAFARHGLVLPIEWRWSRSLGGASYREENCGIVGGQRIDFLHYYANAALALVRDPAHAPAWGQFPDLSAYNMAVEQMMLSVCVDYHRFHPGSAFRDVQIKYLFPTWEAAFDPTRAARAGYTHLLGDSKSDPAVVQRLENRVESEDPEFYRHCVRLGQRLAGA
jgi:hypothetical protein